MHPDWLIEGAVGERDMLEMCKLPGDGGTVQNQISPKEDGISLWALCNDLPAVFPSFP